MADVSLREAAPDDRELLLELMGEFYAESGYPLDRAAARRAFGELLGDPGLGRVWLVTCDGAPAGYLALTLGFSLEYLGRDAFVDDFYLRPAFRGRGIGTRVLAHAEAQARRLGVRALHLEVDRANAAGQALYRKRGFRDNERRLLTKRLAEGKGAT